MVSRPQFETQADALLREQFRAGGSSAGLGRPNQQPFPVAGRGTWQPFAPLPGTGLMSREMERLVGILRQRAARRRPQAPSMIDTISAMFRNSG